MTLTDTQLDVLWQWAGLLPGHEIAGRLSEVGPFVSTAALHQQVPLLGISLKRRQRRLFERNPWSPEEESRLRSLAGRVDVHEITRKLNAEFRSRRRFNGVRVHMNALGLSSEVVGLLTIVEVRRALAVSLVETARLLHDGELHAVRHPIAPGGVWGIAVADLEAYIRSNPLRVRWQEMPPGRWQTFARQGSLRTPYVTLDEAARIANVGRSEMCRRLNDGRVTGAVLYLKRWRIPVAGLHAICDTAALRRARPTLADRLLDVLTPHWQTCVALAKALDTTEGTIYQAVRDARRAGYRVERAPRLGYRLAKHRSKKAVGVS